MRHVVIMAGGSGTRFWPLSRKTRPKQLLPLWEDRTLLQVTADRTAALAPPERTYVVTGRHLAEPIMEQLDLPPENIIVEPCARNTLPCIALAASVIKARDPDATMAIFPADHYISGQADFVAACELGEQAAREGRIATLGITPSRPETGYGYIRFAGDEGPTRPVAQFVEKPDLATAEMYLADGSYLWNAGMFFVSTATMAAELQRQRPAMAAMFADIDTAIAEGRTGDADALFARVEGISVDYGIMEGARDVVVVPTRFEWNDVGHWAALDRVLGTDDANNVVTGFASLIDTRDSVVVNRTGGGKLVAVVGLEDVVVVDTDDATLVIPKSQAQRVREIVDWLKSEGRNELL